MESGNVSLPCQEKDAFMFMFPCAGQCILVCVLFKEFLPKVIYDSSSVLCPMECGSEWFQDFTGSK